MHTSQFSGKLIVITAPSGAGKTTVKRHLMARMDSLGFSVSATTRTIRDGEVDGVDYHFMDVQKFEELIANNALVEWQQVYPGKYYGTLKSELQKLWEDGKQAVLDIDVQGAINIKAEYGEQCFVLFIKPPTLDILRQRLQLRDTETEESLRIRVHKAESELLYADSFDAFVINDDLELAVLEAQDLVTRFLEQK
jgi:guanylate kinase